MGKTFDAQAEARRIQERRKEQDEVRDILKKMEPPASRREQLSKEMQNFGLLASLSGSPRLGGVVGTVGQSMMPGAGGIAVAGAMVTAANALTDAGREIIRMAGEYRVATASLDPDRIKTAEAKQWEWLPIVGKMVSESKQQNIALKQQIDQTSTDLGQYHPQLAEQLAMNEVQKVMGDLKRAELLGPSLAAVQAERSSQLEQDRNRATVKLLQEIKLQTLEIEEKAARERGDAKEAQRLKEERSQLFLEKMWEALGFMSATSKKQLEALNRIDQSMKNGGPWVDQLLNLEVPQYQSDYGRKGGNPDNRQPMMFLPPMRFMQDF